MDFFWINRNQRSFEWFVNLLSQLEIEQAELGGAMERFLEMHMYITSALQKTDMKAVGLQLALDLLHEKVYFYALFSGVILIFFFRKRGIWLLVWKRVQTQDVQIGTEYSNRSPIKRKEKLPSFTVVPLNLAGF